MHGRQFDDDFMIDFMLLFTKQAGVGQTVQTGFSLTSAPPDRLLLLGTHPNHRIHPNWPPKVRNTQQEKKQISHVVRSGLDGGEVWLTAPGGSRHRSRKSSIAGKANRCFSHYRTTLESPNQRRFYSRSGFGSLQIEADGRTIL